MMTSTKVTNFPTQQIGAFATLDSTPTIRCLEQRIEECNLLIAVHNRTVRDHNLSAIRTMAQRKKEDDNSSGAPAGPPAGPPADPPADLPVGFEYEFTEVRDGGVMRHNKAAKRLGLNQQYHYIKNTDYSLAKQIIMLYGGYLKECKRDQATHAFSTTINYLASKINCSRHTIWRRLKILQQNGIVHYKAIRNHGIYLQPDLSLCVCEKDNVHLTRTEAESLVEEGQLSKGVLDRVVEQRILLSDIRAKYVANCNLKEAGELSTLNTQSAGIPESPASGASGMNESNWSGEHRERSNPPANGRASGKQASGFEFYVELALRSMLVSLYPRKRFRQETLNECRDYIRSYFREYLTQIGANKEAHDKEAIKKAFNTFTQLCLIRKQYLSRHPECFQAPPNYWLNPDHSWGIQMMRKYYQDRIESNKKQKQIRRIERELATACRVVAEAPRDKRDRVITQMRKHLNGYNNEMVMSLFNRFVSQDLTFSSVIQEYQLSVN